MNSTRARQFPPPPQITSRRQGSAKEQTDIMDLRSLVIFVFWGQPELNFDNGPLKNDLENTLISLLQKRPDLRQPLRQKIKCKPRLELILIEGLQRQKFSMFMGTLLEV
jgi:hypothetical protein